ncbi:putative papain-like cysteine peptidase superfamily [Helianthus anomalus]
MLFLTVMVECNRNGRMKEWILKSLTGHTDFSKINWCAYVIQQIKSCKDGWKRCDPDSPFSGPLTLLALSYHFQFFFFITLLLYVDRVKCTGLEVDRSINPIVFWNKNELKKRERLEIKTGGFGRGSLHEVAVVKRDSRKTELRVNDEVLNNEIESIRKHLDVMEAKKITVQKKLEVLFNAHPRNVQVQKLIQRYENIVHSRKTRVWLVPDTPQKKIAGVLMSLKKTVQNPENDYTEEDQDNAATAAEVANVDDGGQGDKTQEKIPDSPATTQKNGTCVVTRDEESQAKDQEKKATPRSADVDETSDAMNQEDKKSKEEETKNKINGKGVAENDIRSNAWVKELESKRIKPIGRFNRSCDDHDDGMEIEITSEEQHIWDFLFDIKYSIDIIFKSIYGTEITKTLMRTLREEVKVFSDVVDAWVDLMNFEEVERTNGDLTRIYFRTTVIVTDAGAYEFIGLKMVFFPILENDQYYLIVFDLKKGAITVIDHRPGRTPLVGIRDHQDYYIKDTPYKVKHMMDAYLELCEHPAKDEITAAKIERCNIKWATPAHPMDSAVFLMQHMQKFNGINEPFECGFSSHWKKKQKQILALRKKIRYTHATL